ncbi:hypothetical protein Sjap_008631 [Stephania japonica]|uniref:R13L1/DRL21-like LRR repeat region domain-containing protein n=1 Tax=Stephania japonica TaxID=461633 RepID=A0AAP0PBJ2_9MAGN
MDGEMTIWPHLLVENSKSLRVLDLSSTSIKRLQLPTDVKLKNLKYLDLSHTSIEELPEFVTQLYNLQTLRLEQCKHLEKLPDDLPNLVNLRHLHIDTSGKWEEMPQRMDRLSNLQILPIFILSKEDPGRSIKELERLEKLRGRLKIFRLEDAEGKMFTKKGILKERKNVHTLSLHWSDVRRGKNFQRLLELLDDEHDNDVAVLERLQPHSNLKELRIQDFRGAEFPTWLTTASELSCLVEMRLWGCYKLERVPCFGELPSLKVLHLRDLKKLKCLDGSLLADRDQVISNEQGTSAAEAKAKALYPSLKQLVLHDLPDLEEWLDGAGLNSPSLEQLNIRKCPKLRKTPNSFHSLKRLVFKEVNGMGISSITSCLSSLISLCINGCDDVQYLSEVMLSNNNHLESLSIAHCSYFQGFLPIPESEGILTSVRLLKISDCCKLSSLDLRNFVHLRELIVSNCEELQSLEGLHFLTALEKLKIGPLSQRLHSFPFAIEAKHLKSLRDLRISGWPNLKFQPDQLQLLTTLKFLWIRDFDDLKTLSEWLEKLSSLQRLVIQNCQNMMQLPPENDLKRLTSLMKLYVGNCPNLRTGEAEWHNRSQFPVVRFEVPSHLVW